MSTLETRRLRTWEAGTAPPQRAWRIILRWTQAQMALIETGMVSAAEVFHPYMMIDDQKGGRTTLFHGFIESQLRALPPGKEE